MQKEIISEKVKSFLSKKLQESERKIIQVKRKQKCIKYLYGASIIVSIVLSSSVAAIASLFGLSVIPAIIITVFSTTSAITTALSTKFNLKGKKEQLQNMIDTLNRIKNKLDYVLTCNGDLTEAEYVSILKEFT